MKIRPNLFSWATSELSQDAFICWLLQWGDPKFSNSKLFIVALRLMRELSINKNLEIKKLKIRRQYKNIDIVVVINDSHAILIEDKVHTINRNNQLDRYAITLQKEFDKEQISLIYFKTGDQSNYRDIKAKGYRIYSRFNFLKLLKYGLDIGVKNDIYQDYYNHLINIENSVLSYKNLPISKWHDSCWKGFFIELQNQLNAGNWDKVNQKDGGFFGFWWFSKCKTYQGNKFDFYLQLEWDQLCFKISPYNVKFNREIRDYFRFKLIQKAQELNIPIKKSGRCEKGKTKTMTVAKLDGSYIKTDDNGIIDIIKTANTIRSIQTKISQV